jgi:hypothetical protein
MRERCTLSAQDAPMSCQRGRWPLAGTAVAGWTGDPRAEGVPVTDKLGLGLNLGYWVRPGDASALVLAAERLGYESVWTAERGGRMR